MKICVQWKALALPGWVVGSATILLVLKKAFSLTQRHILVFRKFRIINFSKPSDDDVTYALTLHTRGCWQVLSPTYFQMSSDGIDSVAGKRGLFTCWTASLFLLQRLKGSVSGNARDFNNVETRAVIEFLIFFPARQGTERNSCHSDRNIRGTYIIVCRQKLGGSV